MSEVSVSVPDSMATEEEKCWKQYFEYLCSWTGLRPPWMDGVYTSYRLVLKALFSKEFYWTVELDSNRASDGKYQREAWVEQVNSERVAAGELPYDCAVLRSGVNTLEVLIGLARRMEDDFMRNTFVGDRSRWWFWKMLENAELLEKTDLMMEGSGYDCLCCKITDILDRKFSRDGKPGFFPIRNVSIDARSTQLWDLAMVWLCENYYHSGWLD